MKSKHSLDLKRATIEMFKCPECMFNFGSSVLLGDDSTVQCWKCNKRHHFDHLVIFPKRILEAKCENCRRRSPLIEDYCFNPVYNLRVFQCSKCLQEIAARYGRRLIRPQDILRSVASNLNQDSYFSLFGDFVWLNAKSGNEWILADRMNKMAKSENTGFKTLNQDDFNVWVVLANGNAAGYIAHNTKQGLPILRQLYILPEYRNQGIASKLIETWIEEYATNGKFGIEDPVPATQRILKSYEASHEIFFE